MSLTLKQLRIGKVDGKHEYLTPLNQRQKNPFDAFLIPDSVEPERMNNEDVFFVSGFRGTGKTSLLRWHADQMRQEGAVTDFVLFKTDLTEAQRLHLSKEVGISWADLDPKSMEIAQDFKAAWLWFILHKLGEIIKENNLYDKYNNSSAQKAIRLLGLNDESIFKKAIGFMPKLDGANVKIRADAGFFEAELGGDFKKSGDQGEASLDSLCKKVMKNLSDIKFGKKINIYFDELEVFYHTPEQHRRDQRMVRDLIFSISQVNNFFRKSSSPIHVLAAVRSEVIDNMGSLGQEVDRLVHDRGFHISWHHANRSLSHPLIQIIKKKIQASEISAGLPVSVDPIEKYFSKNINGVAVDAFLLDKSFYKPRDIVWRLSIAQNLFPNESRFSVNVLHETETEYSGKLWDEVRYELSAIYSDDETEALEMVLSGGAEAFVLEDMQSRFDRASLQSRVLVQLLQRRSVREILADLYRLGAVGNSFRAGSTATDLRFRWSFRGEPNLLPEKRMIIHPALIKRLSVVKTRRRGTRGGV